MQGEYSRQTDRWQAETSADHAKRIRVARQSCQLLLRYFLSTPDDAFLPSLSLGFSLGEADDVVKESTTVSLFTDRAIYRPGQEVAFSGIVYTIDGTKTYDAGDVYEGSTYHAPKTIRRVTIQSVGGKAFNLRTVYTIATNDFLSGEPFIRHSTVTIWPRVMVLLGMNIVSVTPLKILFS